MMLLGLNQQQLAKLASVHESTLSRALQSLRPDRSTVIEKVCVVLDMTLEELSRDQLEDVPISRPHPGLKGGDRAEEKLKKWIEERRER